MTSTRRSMYCSRIDDSTTIEEYGRILENWSFNRSSAIEQIIISDRRDVFLKHLELILELLDPMAIFKAVIKNPWMFIRLKPHQNYTTEQLWLILYYMRTTYLSDNFSMRTLYDMQDCFCCLRSVCGPGVGKMKRFLATMVMLRARRFRLAKKVIYYYIIRNVVCNPDHPVGKKLILNEYNKCITRHE